MHIYNPDIYANIYIYMLDSYSMCTQARVIYVVLFVIPLDPRGQIHMAAAQYLYHSMHLLPIAIKYIIICNTFTPQIKGAAQATFHMFPS